MEWKDLMSFILNLKFVGAISCSAVFLYFYSQFIRITSKYFERKYFTGKYGFPTTYFMLYSDQTYSTDYKDKFRDKVRKELKLDLLDVAKELEQPDDARKRLNECFNHIRLKVGSGKLVLKHNIWYGFTRNLIGGSIYASIFCVANIILGFGVFRQPTLVVASFVLLAVYVSILAFHRAILIQNAEAYGRQLISEYMTSSEVAANS